MDNKEIAQVAVFASLYYVLGIIFQPISFMAIQVRVACALIPLIALFGYPGIIGITIGGFIFNMNSPLGFLDLLSMFLFIPAKLAINKWGIKAIPLHVLSVALWVGYMLNSVFGLPLIPVIISVGIGEAVAELVLGLPLYYAVRKRL